MNHLCIVVAVVVVVVVMMMMMILDSDYDGDFSNVDTFLLL